MLGSRANNDRYSNVHISYFLILPMIVKASLQSTIQARVGAVRDENSKMCAVMLVVVWSMIMDGTDGKCFENDSLFYECVYSTGLPMTMPRSFKFLERK